MRPATPRDRDGGWVTFLACVIRDDPRVREMLIYRPRLAANQDNPRLSQVT